MTTLAVVPARGGSKGLPRKHLLPLHGKPLIAWTIEAALEARLVDEVIVTSDCESILAVAARYPVRLCRRPEGLAGDDVPSEPVVAHALDSRGRPDRLRLLLLQATSPLRDARDIDAALALMSARGADAVISVFEPAHNPFKSFVLEPDGRLRGLVYDEAPFQPRQSLPRALMPNGAIYGVRTELFRRTGRLFGPLTVPYEMPRSRSVDIDVLEDLHAAERAMRHGQEAA